MGGGICQDNTLMLKLITKTYFETAGFVYLSVPADAVIPTRNGLPQTYKRIPRHVKAVQADFVLDRQAKHENYTVLMVADPQVRTFGVDNSMETLCIT
jgi:hypothetical protein